MQAKVWAKMVMGLALVSLCWPAQAAMAGKKGDQCLCRGGEGMSVGMVLHKDKEKRFLYIQFKKAGQAGKSQSPAAGECALMYDKFKSGDPSEMRLGISLDRTAVRCTKSGCSVDTSNRFFDSVRRAIKEQSMFEVDVRRSKKGNYYVVTRVGP